MFSTLTRYRRLQVANPTISLTTVTSSPVLVDQSVVYDLTMVIPEQSEGTYSLEILAPYNESAARMKICDVFVLRKGVNVPCFTDEVGECVDALLVI